VQSAPAAKPEQRAADVLLALSGTELELISNQEGNLK
jgi:hypothetical protein